MDQLLPLRDDEKPLSRDVRRVLANTGKKGNRIIASRAEKLPDRTFGVECLYVVVDRRETKHGKPIKSATLLIGEDVRRRTNDVVEQLGDPRVVDRAVRVEHAIVRSRRVGALLGLGVAAVVGLGLAADHVANDGPRTLPYTSIEQAGFVMAEPLVCSDQHHPV